MKNGVLMNRVFSFAIMWTMIIASFSGALLMTLSSSSEGRFFDPLPEGDVLIGSDFDKARWDIVDRVHYMDGNLTIRAGGVVKVVNGGISFTQDNGPDGVPGTSDDRSYTLTIEDGGMLILERSILTTHLDQLDAFPSLGVLVRGGGTLIANDSTLQFPGHMFLDASTLIMRNSEVIGHDTERISGYCNPTYFPPDAFNDAPVLMFMSSNVSIYDSELRNVFEWSGDEERIYNHTYEFARDDGDRSIVTYEFQRTPAKLGARNNITDQELVNLTANDSAYFKVAPGEVFGVDSFDIGGLVFDTPYEVRLNVLYWTDAGYDGTNEFLWGYQNSGMSSTGITPSDTALEYNTSDNKQQVLSASLDTMTSADMSLLNVTFENDGISTVYLNKLWLSVQIPYPSYRNIMLAGTTSFTAVNSYIGVDFTKTADIHNSLVLEGPANAYLYGSVFDMALDDGTQPSERKPAIITSDSIYEAVALEIGRMDDTEEPLSDLLFADGNNYIVMPNRSLHIEGFNTSGLAISCEAITLNVDYTIGGTYTGVDYIQFSRDGDSFVNTSIGINGGYGTTFELTDVGINTLNDLESLQILLSNTDGGAINIDRLWIEATLSSSVYVYRWLNLSVDDSQSLPVEGAIVDATLQPEGAPAFYHTPDGVLDTPPQDILEYLGKNTTSYNVTDVAGQVNLPLLNEIIEEGSLNSSYAVGSYDLRVSYINATESPFEFSTGVSFSSYPAMDVEDSGKTLRTELTDLELDKPDLTVSSVSFSPSTVYERTPVDITATIENIGPTAAAEFNVTFTDYLGPNAFEIGNVSVDVLGPGEAMNITLQWNNTMAGIHTISVLVDSNNTVMEEREGNNERAIPLKVLKLLPDLSIVADDIIFESDTAFTDIPFNATVTVRNTEGKANAVNATVSFYAGNPSTGGILIGHVQINVPAGASNTTTFTWTPAQIGTYPVYVVVNKDRGIEEYDYANNMASRVLTVQLTPGEPDLMVKDDDAKDIIGYQNWTYNIIVKDNGTLLIDSATLNIRQDRANRVQIVVQDNGSILMDDSILTSNLAINLYLFGEASLIVMNSSVVQATVSILVDDDARLEILDSIMHANIVAPVTSAGTVYAENSTFTKAWTGFGGSAQAHLTSVSSPSLAAQESAVIYHYRWLRVTILDGKNAPLPEAIANLEFNFNYTPYATAIANQEGKVLFRCLSDRITSEGASFLGNYRVNASFLFDGEWFETESYEVVSFQPYSPPLTRSDRQVTLQILVRGVDLAISASDISLDPTSPTVNQTVTVTIVVKNVGEVVASDVEVTLWVTPEGQTAQLVGMDTVVSISGGGQGTAVIMWSPARVGNHILRVIVDEAGGIVELNEQNNEATKTVRVKNLANLTPVSIQFTPAGQVEESENLVIQVNVMNVGETTAQDVIVDFWLGALDEGELIDSVTISSVASGQTTAAVAVWTASASDDLKIETRTILAVVNPERTVPETEYDDNTISQSIPVFDHRPDLVVVSDLRVFSGENEVDNASVGEMLRLEVDVKNDGLSSVMGVPIEFRASEGDSYTIIGTTESDFLADETVTVNITWSVNVTIGTKELTVLVNPYQEVSERNYTNGNTSVELLINPPDAVISISLQTLKYDADSQVVVRGTVKNSLNNEPLAGLAVTVTLQDAIGQPVGESRTTTTSLNGFFETQLYIPAGSEGNYRISVQTEIGDRTFSEGQDITVSSPFEPSALPWWVWLIIVVAVAAVIIGFSFYLYRYGLGKMVECGECGALIPESARRCPKCGTEFEVGTAKCSECGAWIPANATNCPECGVKFIGEAIPEEEDEYIRKMRSQYEQMVDEHRERAKEELGKKYSDAKFYDWWKKQPSYITFEEWLSQEEERRKTGAFPCPICGTLNPRGAAICHKCGTVFETVKKEKEEEEAPRRKPLRRIVRRPIGKKVVKEGEEAPEESEEGTTEEESPPESTRESEEKKE